jgi:hypothetical protein
MTVFWDAAVCSLVSVGHFPDDGSSKHFCNVRQFLSDYIARHPIDSHLCLLLIRMQVSANPLIHDE